MRREDTAAHQDQEAARHARPLNLLVLIADQLRHDALGYAARAGAQTWLAGAARTPHLDRLAATGTSFTQAVANVPVCVPSRHSFITGLYPHQIGILTNQHFWQDQPPVPTLGQRLEAAGYDTAALGKMHWQSHTADRTLVPDRRGFAFRAGRAVNVLTEGPCDVTYADAFPEQARWISQEVMPHAGPGGEGVAGYVGGVAPYDGATLPEAWLAAQARTFLHDRQRQPGSRQRPFCLLVSLDRPHPPNVVPRDYEAVFDPADVPVPPSVPEGFTEHDSHLAHQMEQRGWTTMDEQDLRRSVARYLTNVAYVDRCFGEVLDALEASGYAEETVVTLFADHGELLGERRRPARGGAQSKYCLYESAIRIPLLIRWPGLGQPGTICAAPVELVDLMPTWLDAVGLQPPSYLPGWSLRPLLQGAAPAPGGWREASQTEFYAHAPTGEPSAAPAPRGLRGQWAVREAQFKLIERPWDHSALYDLYEDPGEVHNRINDPTLADVRTRLLQRLVAAHLERSVRFPALDGRQVRLG